LFFPHALRDFETVLPFFVKPDDVDVACIAQTQSGMSGANWCLDARHPGAASGFSDVDFNGGFAAVAAFHVSLQVKKGTPSFR